MDKQILVCHWVEIELSLPFITMMTKGWLHEGLAPYFWERALDQEESGSLGSVVDP